MTILACPCCELPKREQYCPTCLREGIKKHADYAHNLRLQADRAILRATQLQDGTVPLFDAPSARQTPTPATRIKAVPGSTSTHGVEAWRTLRAQIAASKLRVAALRAKVAAADADLARTRAYMEKANVPARVEALEAVQRGTVAPADLRPQISAVKSQQREVGKRVIQARRVLVREVVDVFGVQRAGKAWEIAKVELPAPEALRNYTSLNINAALVHTIHLLSLMTRYLSIALPFTPTPPTELPHVGRPIMVPNLPFLGTTKWRDKSYVLWMSSTASVAGKAFSAKDKYKDNPAGRQAAISTVVAKSSTKHRLTLTAFGLLAHSVAYLAFTQGVPGVGIRENGGASRDSEEDDEPPLPLPTASGVLVPATSVLELLALIAESPNLGIRAHEPGTSEVLKHLGFGLDVSKVVAAVLAAENARWGARASNDDHEELSEGWDLLDME